MSARCSQVSTGRACPKTGNAGKGEKLRTDAQTYATDLFGHRARCTADSTAIITRETRGCYSKFEQVCIARMHARMRVARAKGREGLVEMEGSPREVCFSRDGVSRRYATSLSKRTSSKPCPDERQTSRIILSLRFGTQLRGKWRRAHRLIYPNTRTPTPLGMARTVNLGSAGEVSGTSSANVEDGIFINDRW